MICCSSFLSTVMSRAETITPLTLLVGNISGPLSGTLREMTGSYGMAWSIAAVLVFIGGILVATTPAPKWKNLGGNDAPLD